MELTVAIATFGDSGWFALAERAAESVTRCGLDVIHIHRPDSTLAEARNEVLDMVKTPWVVQLDADDELEGGFGVYLNRAHQQHPNADVLVPQVRYIHPDGAPGLAHWPRVAGHTDHECTPDCLPLGNWIVVGAAVRTDLARRVPWEEWPRFEDWAFWLGCHQLGALFVKAPDAVYRAHVRYESRNQRGTDGLAVHRDIARAHGVPIP
jgi:glycosyltransferase involved in cell wall biosynthesis